MEKTDLFRNRWLRVTLSLVVSTLTLTLALRNVDLKLVRDLIIAVKPGYIGLALAGVVLSHLMKVFRWKIILGGAGNPLSMLNLLEALTISQFANLTLPLRLGEISRVILLGRRGLNHSFVLGTIVLEKLFDLLIFALLFILLVVMLPIPDWIQKPGIAILILTLLSATLSLIIMYWRKANNYQNKYPFWNWLNRHYPWWRWEQIRSWFLSGLSSLDILQTKRVALLVVLISAGVWSSAILTNQMVFLALNMDLPLSAALLVMIGLQIVFSLPSAPGKLGIFEYICVLALAVYGLDQSGGLSYGILLHIIGYTPVIALGLVFLWRMGFSKAWDDLIKIPGNQIRLEG